NMLGEEDLNPAGADLASGDRILSLMSPTLVVRGGKTRLVLGSAGSNRIPSAVAQVLSAVVDFDLSVEQAVDAPRVHVENVEVEVEGGMPQAGIEGLTAAGFAVNAWPDRNPFFGGLQAVGVDADGVLSGKGDPRRGGYAISA